MTPIEYLYEAKASPFGIVLQSYNVDLLKQKLYQARAKSADPSLNCLQIRTSPDSPNEEIWIVKGEEK